MAHGGPGRFFYQATGVVAAVQLPAVAWLCSRTGSALPVLLAALASLPYLLRLRSPWSGSPAGPVTFVALGWWSACLAFDALMLPAAGAAWAGAPAGAAWGGAWLVAALAAADALVRRPRLRRVTVRVPGLPAALDGYRIGHLTDLHCGEHAPEARVAGWVARLNRQAPDLIAVTGDLIVRGDSHVAAVARALGGLRAKDGVFVSLGNHDYFTDPEALVRALEGEGLTVLRNRGQVAGPGLYVAGADDTWTHRADVGRALAARPAGAAALLLAHDPDLFPEAAAAGVELTLSGHTHGGQLGVPGVGALSLGRFVTRFAAGLFQEGRSWLYVSRGAGVTGPPARFGAPAELTVLTLRRG